MNEELAFQIQLGLILPKMEKALAAETKKIIDEIVSLLSAGKRSEEPITVEPIKEIIMKDFEIFLEDCILPEVAEKLKPADSAVPGEGRTEGTTEDTASEE